MKPNPFVLVIVWFVVMLFLVFPLGTTINHRFFGVGSIWGQLVILLVGAILAIAISRYKVRCCDHK